MCRPRPREARNESFDVAFAVASGRCPGGQRSRSDRPGAGQPCRAPRQCLRRHCRFRRAWPGLCRAGARGRCQRHPVRTAGPGRAAGTGRCHRRAGPARTPRRHGRPVPWCALACDDDGGRDRYQRQNLHRAAAGPGLAPPRYAQWQYRHVGRRTLWCGRADRLHHPAGAADACAAGAAAQRRRTCGGDGSQLARAGPGPRGCRALRRGGVHQPHPRSPGLPR